MIQFSVDGDVYRTLTQAEMAAAYGAGTGSWPFGNATGNDPFYIILDVAESSSFGLGSGNPTIPVTMYVQYVRVYAGQSPSGGTGNLKNTSTYGQSVPLTAMLSVIPPGKNTTPTGTVTFEDNGRVLGTASLINGQMATLAATGLSAGVNSIQAIYGGDTNFAGQLTWTGAEQEITPLDYNPNACTTSTYSALSMLKDNLPIIDTTISGYPLVDMNQVDSLTAAVTQTVSEATSTTTMTSNEGTTKKETFTATVTGEYGGTATGTVTFYNGSTLLGTGTVNANNQAVYSTTSLAAGTYSIKAIYSGDTNLTGSTSSSTTQTVVTAATTTTVTSSVQSQVFGLNVTLTATVTAVAGAGAGPPTGMVSFQDNGSLLGTALLSGTSVATFTTNTLAVGTYTITAVYNGDSSFNGNTGTLAGVLIITQPANQATPTITWTNPAAITYGTALTGTQLDASASVPGTLVYTPPAGTVLSAGTQTLEVSFTPTDTTNYTDTTATAQVTVSPATPTITWIPAAITYGTALSSTQLDATASVSGAFVYNPLAGVVLAAGSHTLATTFTPTDTADYKTVIQTTQLIVDPETLIVSANPETKVYGIADPTLSYTASGFMNGDTSTILTGGLQRAAGENVGSYAIDQGTLAADSNYTISFTGNTLTITPATLTVTANPQTKVYGATDPALTYAASGFQFSDSGASVLTGAWRVRR